MGGNKIRFSKLTALSCASITVILVLSVIFYNAINTNSLNSYTLTFAIKICIPAALVAGFLGFRIGKILEIGRVRAHKIEQLKAEATKKAKYEKMRLEKLQKQKELEAE